LKRHLPFALTTLRLLLGPIALTCALTNVPRWIYLPILITATLSFLMDFPPVDVNSIFALPKTKNLT
jgi:hypothetical protein